jgi:hypothetical protein
MCVVGATLVPHGWWIREGKVNDEWRDRLAVWCDAAGQGDKLNGDVRALLRIAFDARWDRDASTTGVVIRPAEWSNLEEIIGLYVFGTPDD